MLGGMALGSYLRWVLPEHHTQADSKDILMTAAATMGTLIALIIGLLAPRNCSALSAVFICALSMAGAGFLILELNHPLEGRIKISSAPMQKALSLIGK